MQAVNAITLLNAAQIPFSKMDLSGIRIPSANLSHALLHETNLKGADLRDVDLSYAHMEGANFSECDLRGAKFEKVAVLRSKAAINSIDISLDDSTIVSGNENGALEVWAVDDYKLK